MAVNEDCLSDHQLLVEQIEAERIKMVPSFASGVDRIDSVNFNMNRNGLPYEYIVSWTSKSKETKERWEKMSPSQEIREPVKVPCDGACGRCVSPKEVVQFGNCDHNICHSCLQKSPNRVIFDGTPACCNELCVELSVRSAASRTSSSASSFSSFSQIYVVNLRILVFSMETDHISRRQGVCEVNSNTKLSEIREKIKKYVPNLHASNVFYTTRPDFRRSDLVKISVDEMTKQRELRDLDDEEHFTFVVARPGVTIMH